MNPWLMAVLIITNYCGTKYSGHADVCRKERIECIKANAGTKVQDVDIIDECLTDPKVRHEKIKKAK